MGELGWVGHLTCVFSLSQFSPSYFLRALQMDLSAEGRVYAQRYHVHDYPHIGIIDPRTRRLMYKKEGWTQEKPLTAELFAETAMDFCSRHSFDKPPVAPRPVSASSLPSKRAMHEMSEDEQLQAAMRASLGDDDEDDVIVMDDDEEGDEVEYLAINDGEGEDMKPEAAPVQPEEKPSSLIDELVGMSLGDEPANGARIQLRMPDGKRFVRKFDSSASVKTIYAFVAVSWTWLEFIDGKLLCLKFFLLLLAPIRCHDFAAIK